MTSAIQSTFDVMASAEPLEQSTSVERAYHRLMEHLFLIIYLSEFFLSIIWESPLPPLKSKEDHEKILGGGVIAGSLLLLRRIDIPFFWPSQIYLMSMNLQVAPSAQWCSSPDGWGKHGP